MKTIYFVILSLIHIAAFGQITNNVSGLWSDTLTWSNNKVPGTNDSIYLSYDITVDVDARCKAILLNGHNITVNENVAFNIDGRTVDFDNNEYERVIIDNQMWMKQNLNVTHYRNGDSIPEVKDSTAWANLTTGAWCNYYNITANGVLFGKLYNWYAVNDPRGLAPAGWHVPSRSEFDTLIKHVAGGIVNPSFIAGGLLKAINTWLTPNVGATDSFGFTALPGGSRDRVQLRFMSLYSQGGWWTSVSDSPNNAIRFTITNYESMIQTGSTNLRNGWSVRCIKD